MEENFDMTKEGKGLTVYCHFSFKRKRSEGTGLFAVAFYSDFEGKKIVAQKTRKYDLWEDHQFVTAIQAYEHALRTIYEWQGIMRDKGISQVMLVTDNSTLAGWIENPRKNKAYTDYMKKATEMYRSGAPKEIIIGVGLCEVRKYEKSYKFCKDELVTNNYDAEKNKGKASRNTIVIPKNFKSALDIINESESRVEIAGMKEL